MLRISKLMDYGTLVLTHMAAAPEQLFSSTELAQALGLGSPTVSKILKMLGQHGLVSGVRGARGGYHLARDPAHISVAEIIDALDDQPFGLTECTATPGVCQAEADCHLRTNWGRINSIVRSTLEGVSVADMLSPIIKPINLPASSSFLNQAQHKAHDMELL